MRTDLMLNGRRAAGESGSNAAPSVEPVPDINSIPAQSEAGWSIPGRGALSRWRPDAGSSVLAGRAALPVFDDHDPSRAADDRSACHNLIRPTCALSRARDGGGSAMPPCGPMADGSTGKPIWLAVAAIKPSS